MLAIMALYLHSIGSITNFAVLYTTNNLRFTIHFPLYKKQLNNVVLFAGAFSSTNPATNKIILTALMEVTKTLHAALIYSCTIGEQVYTESPAQQDLAISWAHKNIIT